MNRMYGNIKTFNPSVGCSFNCTYCKPSFQALMKRVGYKIGCQDCIDFKPHNHPERLIKIPTAEILWTFSSGDIFFHDDLFVRHVIGVIYKRAQKSNILKAVYFQSKQPSVFNKYTVYFTNLSRLVEVVLLTTLETNRSIFDDGTLYSDISKAPEPIFRYQDFRDLDWANKIVTVEPVMDFDLDVMIRWVKDINPKSVYAGYNSRPKQVQLPEPSFDKFAELCQLIAKDRPVHIKNIDRLPLTLQYQLLRNDNIRSD